MQYLSRPCIAVSHDSHTVREIGQYLPHRFPRAPQNSSLVNGDHHVEDGDGAGELDAFNIYGVATALANSARSPMAISTATSTVVWPNQSAADY